MACLSRQYQAIDCEAMDEKPQMARHFLPALAYRFHKMAQPSFLGRVRKRWTRGGGQ